MDDPVIVCPKCKHKIKLTESLAAPLLEAAREDFERKEGQIRDELQGQMREQLDELREKAVKGAEIKFSSEIEQKSKVLLELSDILKEKEAKLVEAQKSQAEFLRKERELEDSKREMDLTIEKRVQAEASSLRDKARREVEGELGLKVTEKEQVILSMQRQIEDLRRKAEQGSQQLQGEVQEIQLEEMLRSRFPRDVIKPVPKGEFGGDILQEVAGPSGKTCGFILWESKRTRSWSDGWLPKLREDQRAAKAEIAAIVSQALPKDVETFDLIDDIWVVSPRAALPVAVALRQILIELSSIRQAAEGQETKAGMVYEYVIGPRFKQRVQAIVEAFTSMKEDLDKERKVTTKNWAKREEQIGRVVDHTAGLFGELQGMAGKALQEIEELEGAA